MGFLKKYSLNDLQTISSQISVDRKKFEIAIIEDETFPQLERLIKNGYRIELFKDIDRMSILNDFDIIVTDIRGVGKILSGESNGGIHLITEIKRLFPYKYLIAYSASTFNPSYNKYFKMCDMPVDKNTGLKEWILILDEAMIKLSDPIAQWQKTRDLLLKEKVNINEIIKLEQAYIKSIIKKNKTTFTKKITIYGETNEYLKPITETIVDFTTKFIAEIIKP